MPMPHATLVPPTAPNVLYLTGSATLLYVVAAAMASLVMLILVFFPLGISMRSDFAFGLNALLSGVVVDVVTRKKFGRRLVISRKLQYSILSVWIPLCVYIMLARPFE